MTVLIVLALVAYVTLCEGVLRLVDMVGSTKACPFMDTLRKIHIGYVTREPGLGAWCGEVASTVLALAIWPYAALRLGVEK